MARRLDATALTAVVAVRDLQRVAAEMQAGRAATTFRAKQDAVCVSEVRLAEAEKAWHSCFHNGIADLAASSFWSGEAAARRGALRDDNVALVEAGKALDARTLACRLALARHDLARNAHKMALRDRERRREEARLNEIADRAACRNPSR